MLNPALLPDTPGTVRLVDQGDPGSPGTGMVRVRMVRAPINPADLLVLDGGYSVAVDTNVPMGAESVAVVEATGAGVTDLTVGERVLPLERGNWCALRLLPRASLIAVPAGINTAQAAMLRINPATAWLLLDALAPGPGEAIVQNAAGSAVAAWVRHFAARRGVTVVDVMRRPAGPDALRDAPDLAKWVRAACPLPITGALDCVAGESSGHLTACLAPGGRMMVFGHLSGRPMTVPSRLMTGGGLTVAGFSLRPAEQAVGEEGVRALFAGIFATLPSAPTISVRATLPFARAAKAIALARESGGRVHLAPAISDM